MISERHKVCSTRLHPQIHVSVNASKNLHMFVLITEQPSTIKNVIMIA